MLIQITSALKDVSASWKQKNLSTAGKIRDWVPDRRSPHQSSAWHGEEFDTSSVELRGNIDQQT